MDSLTRRQATHTIVTTMLDAKDDDDDHFLTNDVYDDVTATASMRTVVDDVFVEV